VSQNGNTSKPGFHTHDVFGRYGEKNMMWFIGVCSLIGGISVSVTSGLGAAIVTSAQGDNQVSSFYAILRGVS
jgi:hypothetical protein